jgi:multiple sugar transport system substrate-binding protein
VDDRGAHGFSPPCRRRGQGWRRRLAPLAAAVVAAPVLVACGGGGGGGTPTLNWYIFPEPSGAFATAATNCSKQSNGAYSIKIQTLPSSADGQRQQMVRRLAAKDKGLDILGLDVVWPAEFYKAGWIEEWTGAHAASARQGALPTALETGTVNGKLVAAPFNSNTQLLWYRKDLVPNPPTTWDQMIQQAQDLARQGKPHLVEIQGNSYEGYTVWVNAMVDSAGGSILSKDGTKVELSGPAADRAVSLIGKLANSAAADPSLSVQQEDQNRLAFENGGAAFEINYPFIYPSAVQNNPKLAKNIGWTTYPRVDADKVSRPPVGGIDLAVSSYSKHKEQAFDAIECLRTPQNQIRNAIKGGLPPTLTSLYSNQELIKGGYPFAADIRSSLEQGGIRPQTPAYQSVSIAISNGDLHPPKGASPSKLPGVRSKINDALQSKGLIP